CAGSAYLAVSAMRLTSRFTIEAEDWFRFSPVVRTTLCWFKMLREVRHDRQHPQEVARSVHRLCAAARLAPDPAAMRAAERMIAERVERLDVSRVDWSEFTSSTGPRIGKAVVLKPWLSERERGVVFVSFEGQWAQVTR